MGRATELLNVVNLTISQFSINQQSLSTDLKMSTVMKQLEAIKNQVCKALSFVMMLLMVVMTSCGNSEDEEVRQEYISTYMTESAITLDLAYTPYIGLLNFNINVKSNLDLAALKLEITSVDIFIGDSLVTKLTQSPYTYKCDSIELETGHHELNIKTNFRDLKNGNMYEVSRATNVYIPDSNDIYFSWMPILGDFGSLTSESSISMSPNLEEAGWHFNSIKYYINNELVYTDEKDDGVHHFNYYYHQDTKGVEFNLYVTIDLINEDTFGTMKWEKRGAIYM
jgi:hypothetical protein